MGVSFDAPEVNQAWARERSFGFELWSDQARALALHFGAAANASASSARRVTVLLDAEGKVLLRYEVGIDIPAHPQDVLEDAKALFGPQSP